nr:hypothetical protein [Streptomyces phytophilus]
MIDDDGLAYGQERHSREPDGRKPSDERNGAGHVIEPRPASGDLDDDRVPREQDDGVGVATQKTGARTAEASRQACLLQDTLHL